MIMIFKGWEINMFLVEVRNIDVNYCDDVFFFYIREQKIIKMEDSIELVIQINQVMQM